VQLLLEQVFRRVAWPRQFALQVEEHSASPAEELAQ
jgi:hypothetical protein